MSLGDAIQAARQRRPSGRATAPRPSWPRGHSRQRGQPSLRRTSAFSTRMLRDAFSWVQQASRRKTALERPAVSRSGIPAGSSAPPALGIAGRPCERALNECGEDCESLGASRLAHFGSVPSSVDERTLKGILLLLACCTQEQSVSHGPQRYITFCEENRNDLSTDCGRIESLCHNIFETAPLTLDILRR